MESTECAVDTSSSLTHLALEFDQTHVLIGSGIANNAQVFDAITDVKKRIRPFIHSLN